MTDEVPDDAYTEWLIALGRWQRAELRYMRLLHMSHGQFDNLVELERLKAKGLWPAVEALFRRIADGDFSDFPEKDGPQTPRS